MNRGLQPLNQSAASPRVTPQGAYSATATYAVNDVVTYVGNTYRAVAASSGVTPGTDASKWEYWGGSGPNFTTPLRRTRAGLAAADVTPFDVLCIGDSTTECYGVAIGVGTGFIDKRWPTRLGKLLAARYLDVPTAGVGYVNTSSSVVNGSVGGTAYWTYSGGGSYSSGGFLGQRAYNFSADETATLTFTGTSFQIHYIQGVAVTVPFTLTVDGGSPITVTPATTGGQRTTGVYTSATLSAGTHTIVITPASTKTLFVEGAFIYNGNDGAGVRTWEAAHFGWTSTQMQVVAATGLGAGRLGDYLTVYQPSLVPIFLGLNDYSTGVTPATFQKNIQTIIAFVKSMCTYSPTFLIVTPYLMPQFTTPAYPWAQYQVAVDSIVAADPTNCVSLSLTDRWAAPTSGNGYSNGMMNTDQVHPTAAGYNYIAQAIYDLIRQA